MANVAVETRIFKKLCSLFKNYKKPADSNANQTAGNCLNKLSMARTVLNSRYKWPSSFLQFLTYLLI